MRKSSIFLSFLTACMILSALIFAHAHYSTGVESAAQRTCSEIARRLQLTDLCLFTEASYTRHLSQADLNTPFQDHPAALEHFPSGSLAHPPFLMKKQKRAHEELD